VVVLGGNDWKEMDNNVKILARRMKVGVHGRESGWALSEGRKCLL
jgi:hypothetical protein